MNRDEMTAVYDDQHFLFGLFFSFGNRLQAAGDAFYEEITCKQFFLTICLGMFRENHPTINELSDVMGSSHQNVKQIVNKMEKNDYVETYTDVNDKRKIRVRGTEKLEKLGQEYDEKGTEFLNLLYKGVSEEDIRTTCQTMVALEQNLIKIRQNMKN